MRAVRIERARAEFDLSAMRRQRDSQPFGGGQGLVHDASNGARATSALCVATQALEDLSRGAGNDFTRRKRRAHVMVGEHVAGADNHCKEKHSVARSRRCIKPVTMAAKIMDFTSIFVSWP